MIPRRLASLTLVVALVGGCGAISAPPGAADLRETPGAFEQAFDRAVGSHRLVLLLSPA